MTLIKRLLNVLYYFLLISTVVFAFMFMSAFDYIFDGGKHIGDFAKNWLEIFRMLWGIMLALNAAGLFAVIVLRRRQVHMSNAAVILFMAIIFLAFVLPPMVFLFRMVWF